MTAQARAAFKADTAAAIYTNVDHDVTGNAVRDRINGLADSALIGEAWETISSASTTNLGSTSSNFARISGTVAINSFGTAAAGTFRKLRFNAVLTLNDSASIIIPGNADITTAGDDLAEVVSEGGGVWRVLSYTPADGKAVIAPAFSEVTGKPTTLAGYGITNAVEAAGDTMTGALQVPAGLVGTPGLRLGDADTGLYRTAGEIHFALDGVEGARFSDATGFSMFGANVVIDDNRLFRLRNYTVATLPAAGIAGRLARVSDALAPTMLEVLTGGGSVKTPVFDNGTDWVSF